MLPPKTRNRHIDSMGSIGSSYFTNGSHTLTYLFQPYLFTTGTSPKTTYGTFPILCRHFDIFAELQIILRSSAFHFVLCIFPMPACSLLCTNNVFLYYAEGVSKGGDHVIRTRDYLGLDFPKAAVMSQRGTDEYKVLPRTRL